MKMDVVLKDVYNNGFTRNQLAVLDDMGWMTIKEQHQVMDLSRDLIGDRKTEYCDKKKVVRSYGEKRRGE